LFKPGTKADALDKPDASPTLEEVTKGAFPSHEIPGTPASGKKNDYPPAFRGTGRLYCLDATDGTLKWDVNLFDHRMSTWFGSQQGNSIAPLKVGDNIVVSYDIDGCLGVGAFNTLTGENRWIAKAPKAGMNARSARIAVATRGSRRSTPRVSFAV